MKKMLVFAVMMLMSTAAQVFAVNFSFASVSEVKQVGNEFLAYTAGGEAVAISALQYKQMSEATGFYIIDVDGQKVVAAGNEFVVEPLEVERVSMSVGKPEVFFTNGTSKVFTKDEWLKAQKGQKVRRIYLNCPTWEFENYGTIAEGEVVVFHDKVAPVKKVTVTQLPAVATTTTTSAVATTTTPATPTAPAQGTNEELPVISFTITH